MIGTVGGTPDGTHYRILSYDTYAVLGGSERDGVRDTERDASGTAAGQQRDSSGTRTTMNHDHYHEPHTPEYNAREARSLSNGAGSFNDLYQLAPSGPIIKAEREYFRAIDAGLTDHETMAMRWPEYVRRQKAADLNIPHLANWIRDGGWGDESLDERTVTMDELLEGIDGD